MDEIELTSTSATTAVCSPVPLRVTDRVRLVFHPTVVINPHDPRACVRGEFVYQKKSSNGEWRDVQTDSLATIKTGEAFKLELKSAEMLSLVNAIGPIYRMVWTEKRIPRLPTRFVRMGQGLAQLITLSESELEQFLDAHPNDAVAVLGRVLTWLAKRPVTTKAAAALAAIDPDRLPSITALLGVSTLRAALEDWEASEGNEDEDFWQRMLSRHAFVLSQLFAHPIIVIKEKAFLGGKHVDNRGGSYVDFLVAAECTTSVALVEIKTPATPLLGPAYRTDALPPSSHLAGAVAQVLKYRSTFVRAFDALNTDDPRRMLLGGCPAFVVVGHSKQLDTTEKKESFERFRSQLRDVTIICFDELFSRVAKTVHLLDGPS